MGKQSKQTKQFRSQKSSIDKSKSIIIRDQLKRKFNRKFYRNLQNRFLINMHSGTRFPESGNRVLLEIRTTKIQT